MSKNWLAQKPPGDPSSQPFVSSGSHTQLPGRPLSKVHHGATLPRSAEAAARTLRRERAPRGEWRREPEPEGACSWGGTLPLCTRRMLATLAMGKEPMPWKAICAWQQAQSHSRTSHRAEAILSGSGKESCESMRLTFGIKGKEMMDWSMTPAQMQPASIVTHKSWKRKGIAAFWQ